MRSHEAFIGQDLLAGTGQHELDERRRRVIGGLVFTAGLLRSLLAAPSAQAQRGDIVVPTGAQLSVPSGAEISASGFS